jgi:hypothetical protein
VVSRWHAELVESWFDHGQADQLTPDWITGSHRDVQPLIS